MKYTTLPTKPGRYIDRIGDKWTLTEDMKWYYYTSSYPARMSAAEDWFPFTDALNDWLPFTDAPNDDEPTSTGDNVQRIEDIKDIKFGDRVYFHNDPNGYKFMDLDRKKNCLRVSLRFGGGPAWLCDELPDYMLIDKSFFDYAERPKPSWPEPEGTKLRMYLGADGERYAYAPTDELDQRPWLYNNNNGNYVWSAVSTLMKERPEALPLREFTAPEDEA